jgi:signal transduction histidine kinase
MLNLIEDILDMSRLEFNNFELNISFFKLEEIVNEIYEMMGY